MQDLSKQTKLRLWLIVVGVATLLLGSAYALAQQSTRLAAYDLPLATAQSTKHQLEDGIAPIDTIPTVKTDLGSDSTVFVIVSDSSSHVLASSAQLSGQTPLPPSGVFAYTQTHGTDHFTWEPIPGVRLATEVLHYGGGSDGGYVIVGQSLSQAENRIQTYGYIAAAGWVGVIAWTSLLIYWAPKAQEQPTKQKPKAKKAARVR